MTIRRHGRVADLTWLLDHRHDLGRHRLGAGSEGGVAIRQLWYPAREAAWSTLALHYSTVRVEHADLSKEFVHVRVAAQYPCRADRRYRRRLVRRRPRRPVRGHG